MRKKNKAGGIMHPDFTLYYKVIKTVWYWQNNQHMDQWNRIEGPERNPHMYSQLSTAKETRICNRERTDSSINGLRKLDNHIQKNETGPLSYTIHKSSLKWIKDLNTKPETIKLLQENIIGKLLDMSLATYFLERTPKAMQGKAKTNKCDYIKLKAPPQEMKSSAK